MSVSTDRHRPLALALLGPFEMICDGEPVALAGIAARALLGYLAVESDRPHPRELMARMLWPELPQSNASNNLRQTVFRLRSALPGDTGPLRVTRSSLQFVADPDGVDIIRFESLLAVCAAHAHPVDAACGGCTDRREQAVALYRGELLEGLFLGHSPGLEQWLLLRREQLQRRVVDVLHTLAVTAEEAGDHPRMLTHASRQVSLEQCREEGHRQVMRALAGAGDRVAALGQYKTCLRTLDEELGMAPERATTALYQQIMTSETAGPPVASGGRPESMSVGYAWTLDASPVPSPTSALHGRRQQLAALTSLLVRQRARLVTLTGAGGCGKTRLSIELARQVQDCFPDGAAFVRLSAVRDPALVALELGRQLGIASPARGNPLDALRAVLRNRSMLIVVDNFEQVIAAAAVVGELTEACPGLSMLVTSRRPLQLRGERVLVVPPLSLVPEVSAGAPVADAPAVALFCERAAAVDPDFVRNPKLLDAIAAICRWVDGLPLAIELAAARSRTLPADALLSRLAAADQSPWHLLNRGPADAAPRHRGLFEAIAWSVDLLDPADAVLFRRLGVFEGTWTIEAAEAVCVGAAPSGLAVENVIDALSSLVDLHLVEPVRSATPSPRFGFLDTIRLVARRLLGEAGESNDLAHRHAEHFLGMMIEAGGGLEGPDESRWYVRIDAELPELRAALTWLDGTGRAEDVLSGAGALGPYWLHRGQLALGRRWLTSSSNPGTTDPGASVAPEVTARARGWSARLDVDGAASVATLDQAAELVRELVDVRTAMSTHRDGTGWLRACDHLSYALRIYGDVERAWSVTQEALDRCGEPHQIWWRAEHLLRGALLAEQRGDVPGSREYGARALAAARVGGNDRVHARAVQALVMAGAGDPGSMSAGLLEALALSEACGDRRGAAATLVALGAVGRGRGEAAAWFGRSIVASREIGYRNGAALGVAGVVGLASESGSWRTAAILHGALGGHLPRLRGQLTHLHAAAYDREVEHARRAAGGAAFDAEAAHGAQLDWESAVDRAIAAARSMADDSHTPPARTAPATARVEPAAQLSPREHQILGLIADGLTNPEIARTLYVSPKTVMHHTSAIYRKLGVRGRAEAVARAARIRAAGDLVERAVESGGCPMQPPPGGRSARCPPGTAVQHSSP